MMFEVSRVCTWVYPRYEPRFINSFVFTGPGP